MQYRKPPAVSTIRSARSGLVVGAISPNGHTFGYGEHDGTVHFVDVADGRTWSGTAAHSADVQSMAFSPDSRLAVSTGSCALHA